MKLKLDENLPVELVGLFAAAGHDAHTVFDEQLAGRDDQTILHAAQAEGRILFTQDLDFSDLRQFHPGTHPGIVLIRLRDPSRRQLIARLRQLQSESLDSWAGCFIVISDHKLRIKRPA